ncbi:hypothetical protein CDAR_71391 [Caerostris darwini]|uniref:Uncharacterized protein n=1 Tax=Caerostris darwini TaxID=1538125 RepID=A0AAV4RF04_9ARAC|nr:hypothetical protein CDAR_71391 [Caerostris darwini]
MKVMTSCSLVDRVTFNNSQIITPAIPFEMDRAWHASQSHLKTIDVTPDIQERKERGKGSDVTPYVIVSGQATKQRIYDSEANSRRRANSSGCSSKFLLLFQRCAQDYGWREVISAHGSDAAYKHGKFLKSVLFVVVIEDYSFYLFSKPCSILVSSKSV